MCLGDEDSLFRVKNKMKFVIGYMFDCIFVATSKLIVIVILYCG